MQKTHFVVPHIQGPSQKDNRILRFVDIHACQSSKMGDTSRTFPKIP